MAIKTKNDWSDSTWNPVTGCLHDCNYCYAKKISKRFGGWFIPAESHHKGNLHDLDKPFKKYKGKVLRSEKIIAPYPYDFDPTFHRYRLDIPKSWKKPRTIFVCSMADLFGDWVPDDWIDEVFKACAAAPQHRYLFLTKNPKRYVQLAEKGLLPQGDNYWYGSSVTNDESPSFYSEDHNAFLSIEPILGAFDRARDDLADTIKWVIIGAETGSRKDKVIPKREWIETIVNDCKLEGVPVFLKESLTEIWKEPLIQEFPWEVRS
jgi:protein gp37